MIEIESMDRDERAAVAAAGRLWWIWLLTGILWVIIAWVILRFRESSITTVGVIVGFVFVGATVNEIITMSLRRGWRWVHALLAVIFGLGALWCFVQPKQAFWALASVIGLLFILKGTFEIIESAMTKDVNDLWWLGLTAGILMLLLGFWASQQYYTARAALILIWVGLGALFRGVQEIAVAFHVRKLAHLAAE